jgi:hypothetical protein
MQPQATLAPEATPVTGRARFFTVAVNNLAIFVLTYYLVSGAHEVAKFLMSAYRLYLRGSWDPSYINYSLSDAEWVQRPLHIIAAYGVGPLVCLALAVGAFFWFWKVQRAKRGNFKLLLLWVAFHGCNLVLGALLADTFTQSGFWYVPSWVLAMGNVVNVLLAIVAGLAQLALGYFASVAFLQAHDSITVMLYVNRRPMVMYTLILPWLAGSLFIILAKMPYTSIHEILHLAMLGLLIVPMVLGCLNESFESTVQKPRPTRLALGWIGLALLLALVWRLALSPPVLFG